jgi:hypothetical protein
MTKSQWKALRTGDKVTFQTFEYDYSIDMRPILTSLIKVAEIIRFNSNCSQVEIEIDGKMRIWKGRTQLEIVPKFAEF